MIADSIKTEIQDQLGEDALASIIVGNPQIIDCTDFLVVDFTFNGFNCEYYPDTDPILLREVDGDREFVSFEDLQETLGCLS